MYELQSATSANPLTIHFHPRDGAGDHHNGDEGHMHVDPHRQMNNLRLNLGIPNHRYQHL